MKTNAVMIRRSSVCAVVIAFVAHCASTAAHHSFSVFDDSKCQQITGTIRALEWKNPHAWLWVTVPEGQPGAGTWGFEGDSPALMKRNGWSRTVVKPGDKATISFAPLRSRQQGGAFGIVALHNGQVLRGTINARACKLPPVPVTKASDSKN